MAGTPQDIVTVFGGTGFLGRRIVRSLREAGAAVRVASRHPERAAAQPGNDQPPLQTIAADVDDQPSVARALAGARAAVNAVSLYVEDRSRTFRSVHVLAAARVARQAAELGVGRFIHVSGVGADPTSRSPYIRSRGEGESAVLKEFPGAAVIRPTVMFGPDDAFIATIAKLLRVLPVYPMFGRGKTKLQPVYVEDVAAAIARIVSSGEPLGGTYELAGPRVYSYAELIELIGREIERRPRLLAVPFGLWHALASMAEMLPAPPVTRNQVELMALDNIAAVNARGFSDLQIAAHALDDLLPKILGRGKPVPGNGGGEPGRLHH
jgi:uncharacterized protein YbjT (DUF2867 family)